MILIWKITPQRVNREGMRDLDKREFARNKVIPRSAAAEETNAAAGLASAISYPPPIQFLNENICGPLF